MKSFVCVFLCLLFLILFSVNAFAYDEIFSELTDALQSDALNLLEEFGLYGLIDGDVSNFTVSGAVKTVVGIFEGELSTPIKTGGVCLALLFVTAVVCNYLPENNGVSLMGKSVAMMCIMFVLISVCSEVFSECCEALLFTGDFMKVLIPIFVGVVSFSGNVSLALSFNSVAFSFAEFICMFFSNTVPKLSAVLMSVCAAGAVNPLMKTDFVGKTFARVLNLLMAFVAGIFVAVLSVRGVISGAADTVGIRGLRFLIGNAVPVVGSALGEALNSIVASLSLIKNSVGVFGVAAVVIINLPVLIKVIIWKGVLYFISMCADITGVGEIKNFSDNMNRIMSVITGAVCFTVFVFVIGIAVILTLGKG